MSPRKAATGKKNKKKTKFTRTEEQKQARREKDQAKKAKESPAEREQRLEKVREHVQRCRDQKKIEEEQRKAKAAARRKANREAAKKKNQKSMSTTNDAPGTPGAGGTNELAAPTTPQANPTSYNDILMAAISKSSDPTVIKAVISSSQKLRLHQQAGEQVLSSQRLFGDQIRSAQQLSGDQIHAAQKMSNEQINSARKASGVHIKSLLEHFDVDSTKADLGNDFEDEVEAENIPVNGDDSFGEEIDEVPVTHDREEVEEMPSMLDTKVELAPVAEDSVDDDDEKKPAAAPFSFAGLGNATGGMRAANSSSWTGDAPADGMQKASAPSNGALTFGDMTVHPPPKNPPGPGFVFPGRQQDPVATARAASTVFGGTAAAAATHQAAPSSASIFGPQATMSSSGPFRGGGGAFAASSQGSTLATGSFGGFGSGSKGGKRCEETMRVRKRGSAPQRRTAHEGGHSEETVTHIYPGDEPSRSSTQGTPSGGFGSAARGGGGGGSRNDQILVFHSKPSAKKRRRSLTVATSQEGDDEPDNSFFSPNKKGRYGQD